MEYIVEIKDLSRKFNNKIALQNISVQLEPGKVYGLMGENGAGKSTLIKHIIGALQPQNGIVKVFGKSPGDKPEEVLSDIGYLSEDRDMPMWMRASELLNYTSAFFDSWDDQYAQELMGKFHLDPTIKLKNMSRGQKARIGLITALAHRPRLLVLDEPSSGLDVSVRYDILSEVVRSAAESGNTILFSSHLLDEVERITDDVIMIHQGKKIIDGHVDEIKDNHHRYSVRFKDETNKVRTFLKSDPQIIRATKQDNDWLVVSNQSTEEFKGVITELEAESVNEISTSLEDVFMDYCSLENYHD